VFLPVTQVTQISTQRLTDTHTTWVFDCASR